MPLEMHERERTRLRFRDDAQHHGRYLVAGANENSRHWDAFDELLVVVLRRCAIISIRKFDSLSGRADAGLQLHGGLATGHAVR